ncbi:sulfurtransferase TusA family protein [Vibrio hangzhouensis]|uniref:TusA-related sulfurtransferase n=1 Tax=Vibrio hangzhouensis TaxID=462991 RepID=A0A1H6BMZ3_9VIBR|nr:sulfurtransferase TusA family protein [Vibrio hangzhouensis]SEG61576.1 TusA-related sulfurtransferase [Vibrio hangzhouensis]
MTEIQLDLVHERCPMSLLVVKRAFKQLTLNQLLSVRLADKSSVSDILQYLSKQNAQVDCLEERETTLIKIRKQDN